MIANHDPDCCDREHAQSSIRYRFRGPNTLPLQDLKEC